MFFDSTFLLLIPALLLAFFAQMKVRSTFEHYSQVPSSSRLSGADAASLLARREGVQVSVEPVAGYLSDHYDPRDRHLSLSEPVYGQRSVAALGVAAHELGHALQHRDGYLPLHLRSGLVPLANLGSTLSAPLFFLGLLMGNKLLAGVGIVFFSAAVLFALITLPVEFDASRRALVALSRNGLVTVEEQRGVRSVLNAAALTYVASALMALTQLLRMVLLARRED